PELAVMRNDRVRERGVENFERFVEALAGLFVAEADEPQLVGNAGRGSDLEPPAGEVIEHADLLDHAPRIVIGQDHAQGAEPQALRARRHVGDDQIGRRAVAASEMMLAEEDALEAERLGPLPEAEIAL